MDSKIIFAGRLLELREHSGLSRQEVADNLNISRASLEYYEKGKRRPDFNTIADIARFFNVSIDYLFGLSDVETTDKDVQFICEYTGLKEESVNWLHGMKFAEQEDDEKEIEEKKNIINSMMNTDTQQATVTRKSFAPMKASAIPITIATIPATGDCVAFIIAGNVMTAKVT